MQYIGRYRLLRKLGAGASGVVFLGFDPVVGREVAIKVADRQVLQDPHSGHLYRKLFETEAALAGRLDHPNLVAIHDARVDAAQAYLVMDLATAGTLEKFCAFDNLLPSARVLDLLRQCVRALAFVQADGIVHRDLKPANILLAVKHGQAKISDFGCAIVPGSGVEPLANLGSPAYMSPEQAEGKALDFRSDMYSLGMTLFHLLTGRLPSKDAQCEIPPPSGFRSDIPRQIDAIVLQASAKLPEQRFQSWGAFEAALDGVCDSRAS